MAHVSWLFYRSQAVFFFQNFSHVSRQPSSSLPPIRGGRLASGEEEVVM